MSCYVINQSEYWKVAGILAAFSSIQNYYKEPLLRIWNKKENRVMNREDFIDLMKKAYVNNCRNVGLHYNESTKPEYAWDSKLWETYGRPWFNYVKGLDIRDRNQDIKNVVMSVISWLCHGYHYQSCDTDRCDSYAKWIIGIIVPPLTNILCPSHEREKLLCKWTEWPAEPPKFTDEAPISISELCKQN